MFRLTGILEYTEKKLLVYIAYIEISLVIVGKG